MASFLATDDVVVAVMAAAVDVVEASGLTVDLGRRRATRTLRRAVKWRRYARRAAWTRCTAVCGGHLAAGRCDCSGERAARDVDRGRMRRGVTAIEPG